MFKLSHSRSTEKSPRCQQPSVRTEGEGVDFTVSSSDLPEDFTGFAQGNPPVSPFFKGGDFPEAHGFVVGGGEDLAFGRDEQFVYTCGVSSRIEAQQRLGPRPSDYE